ncbi:hypothetical protein M0R19_01300 [Candidatus Pacearchaeota archaeon]|jgi:hypothetical protein|nr:hypothetical protein [Candidatus Pacearchaeota archaeon]
MNKEEASKIKKELEEKVKEYYLNYLSKSGGGRASNKKVERQPTHYEAYCGAIDDAIDILDKYIVS